VQTRPLGLHIDGPVGFPADHPMLEHFRFLKPVAEAAGVTPKFSIPAPTVLDFRLERDALEGSAYGGHDDIFDDLYNDL
jgi:5-methyltetrahydropteroyltriglutamate--homocysteine methyltransferase